MGAYLTEQRHAIILHFKDKLFSAQVKATPMAYNINNYLSLKNKHVQRPDYSTSILYFKIKNVNNPISSQVSN